MTNKQYDCITDIKTTLQALTTDIKKVVEFPDGLSQIGQNFPAVMLEDGNEIYTMVSGNTYYCVMEVKVHLFVHIIPSKTKMESLLDLQATINNAILADLTLGGNCVNIVLTEVEKDTVENDAGTQIARRIMKYQIEIHDTRI